MYMGALMNVDIVVDADVVMDVGVNVYGGADECGW